MLGRLFGSIFDLMELFIFFKKADFVEKVFLIKLCSFYIDIVFFREKEK